MGLPVLSCCKSDICISDANMTREDDDDDDDDEKDAEDCDEDADEELREDVTPRSMSKTRTASRKGGRERHDVQTAARVP